MRQMQGQWAQLESWWPGMACHAQGAAAQQRGWNINNNYSQQQQQQPQQWVSFFFWAHHVHLCLPAYCEFQPLTIEFLLSLWMAKTRESREFQRIPWIFEGTDWTHSEAHGEEPWFWLKFQITGPYTSPQMTVSDPHVISKGELYWLLRQHDYERWNHWDLVNLDILGWHTRNPPIASTTSAYELPILNKSEEPLRTWTEKQLRTEKQIMPLALLLLLSARVFPLLLG